ncbi:MAG TPA: hypothetical protein VH157_06910 [Bryobacteraceae bacterium]|jgi:Glu-tRNA(Gln) amidotransferase subunit E-like FAD-binding protein|nr:hypothetical protein [Bryobacteraceae bacterium]
MAKRRKEVQPVTPGPPLTVESAKDSVKARDPRGRKKVKSQISVRIEQSYLDMAYAHAKATGERITDILERGIVKLVAEEMNEDRVARFARFLVLYATPEEQSVVISVLGYLRMPKMVFTTVFNEIYRDSLLKVLEEARKHPAFEEALRSYAPMSDEQFKPLMGKFQSAWIRREEVSEKIKDVLNEKIREFGERQDQDRVAWRTELRKELVEMTSNILGRKPTRRHGADLDTGDIKTR